MNTFQSVSPLGRISHKRQPYFVVCCGTFLAFACLKSASVQATKNGRMSPFSSTELTLVNTHQLPLGEDVPLCRIKKLLSGCTGLQI